MQSRQVSNFKINKMTKAQYSGIVPSQDEVYITTDEADAVLSVNGILPNAQGNVTLNIPAAVTESTVAGWGFTKNEGTVTSVNGVGPTNGNVAITIPTVNNGMLTITQDGNTLGTFSANQSRNGTIDIPSGGTSRNIGEIVSSAIPLTDAGLHLLDGALLQYGIYQAFIDYIADLVTDYPDLFCTEQEWQQSVTTYGVCGKFVYDSVSNTVRLPKITGIVEGTVNPTLLGNLVEAGLPNITGTLVEFGHGTGSASTSGAFRTTYSSQAGSASGSGLSYNKTTFNASRSSSIYGNSTTVQPQTIKVLYYIIVATSTKTDIEVDIDEIATDLNNKVDSDLSNLSATAKLLVSSLPMPSTRYVSQTAGASGANYVAPANGWYYVYASDNTTLHNNSKELGMYSKRAYIPVVKGDVVALYYNSGTTITKFQFIYAIGSQP